MGEGGRGDSREGVNAFVENGGKGSPAACVLLLWAFISKQDDSDRSQGEVREWNL